MSPSASTTEKDSDKRISLLLNSHYYSYEHILIVEYEKGKKYRLVVSHYGRLCVSMFYKSIRGAKIAFCRMFASCKWDETLKPEWSEFYPPKENWLNAILEEEQEPTGLFVAIK